MCSAITPPWVFWFEIWVQKPIFPGLHHIDFSMVEPSNILGFGQKVMGTGHFIALRPFFNFPEVAIHEKHRVSPRRFHWTSHMMMGWTYRLWQGYGLFVFASWQMERRCFLPSSLPIGIETDCARMHMSRKKGLFGYSHWGFQWGKHLINLIWRHQPLSKRMEWI